MRDLTIDNRTVRGPVPLDGADTAKWSNAKAPPEPVPLGGRAQDLGLRGRVDPHAEPQLEHQERPKACVVIAGETAMFVEQTLDVVRAE